MKITDQGLVSAKELYLGLGLREKNWARWYPTNIEKSEFFKKDIDWIGVLDTEEGIPLSEENLKGGRPTIDFAISLEFAKHIAMMARTEKSYEYRNYFIECEKLVSEQAKLLSPREQLKIQLDILEEQDKKIEGVVKKVDDLKENMPLFNIECKELQSLVKKVGIKVLCGYKSSAYNDNSLRGKVYADIQHQLKREFGVERYQSIKRCQLETARKIIEEYKAPTILINEINRYI
ncbi:MAG TPA: ORF6C domain-containing protein [Clostridium sp.]